MPIRNIEKVLAGMEDLLQGYGTASQTRGDTAYTIGKVDVPYAVASEAAMQALDITKFTRARIYIDTNNYEDYTFDAAATMGIAPNVGVGYWVPTYSSAFWTPPSATEDVSDELETFVSNNQGKLVRILATQIVLSGFGTKGNLASTDNVMIDFGRTTVLYDNDTTSIELDNTGNASAEVTVSAVANETIFDRTISTKITLGSTLSAEAHDWIALYSEDDNDSKAGGKLGEIHQLIQDESALDLHTAGTVARPAQFTDTVRCRKLDSSRKVYIKGGIWKANGDADDLAITSRVPAIKILGYVDPKVENVEFEKPWAQCVIFQCCAASHCNTYEVRDTLNNASATGYSYGVCLYGMNGFATVSNGVVRNARHPGFTTDGNSGGSSTWYNKGYPTDYACLNTRGYNCYGSVTDSHEEGERGLIDGVFVHNAVEDERESFIARAHQSRAANETIRNVYISGGMNGVSVGATDHGFVDDVTLENINCNNIYNGVPNAYAIDINDNSNVTKRKIHINGLRVTDCDRGVLCNDENLITMTGAITFTRVDVCLDVHDGVDLVIAGQIVMDFRDITSGGTTCVNVRSEVGSEPSIRILQKPIIMKNAANAPTEFFTEADTNANKNVWHPGIIDFDGGFTATLSKSAGSTTFVDLTDINEVAL